MPCSIAKDLKIILIYYKIILTYPKERLENMTKEKIKDELKLFFIYTAFLTMLFSVFNIYERLLLEPYTNPHVPYGYALIEAMILSKFILIGDYIKPLKKNTSMPLIIPVLIKTILFTLAVLFFTFLEHIITGLLESKDLNKVIYNFLKNNLNIAIAKCVVILFVFFFSIIEIAKEMGDRKLINLFFKSANNRSEGSGTT